MEEGYDTSMRGVAASSALGWFSVLLLFILLKYNIVDLCNVIIHENTHATIYLKDYAEFNESLAMFVAYQGTLLFIEKKFGKNSPEYKYAKNTRHDEKLFSEFIKRSLDKLTKYYARGDITKEAKIKGRDKIFKEIKNNFLNIQKKLKSRNMASFSKLNLNNAVLISYKTYYKDISIFEKLYAHFKKDMKATITFLKDIEKKTDQDPTEYLQKWLKDKPIDS
jgi:predicted aminopeptidase